MLSEQRARTSGPWDTMARCWSCIVGQRLAALSPPCTSERRRASQRALRVQCWQQCTVHNPFASCLLARKVLACICSAAWSMQTDLRYMSATCSLLIPVCAPSLGLQARTTWTSWTRSSRSWGRRLSRLGRAWRPSSPERKQQQQQQQQKQKQRTAELLAAAS